MGQNCLKFFPEYRITINRFKLQNFDWTSERTALGSGGLAFIGAA